MHAARFLPLFPLLGLALYTAPAAATVPDVFGMGPDYIGMAGAATAVADDPSAAYYNPAGIAQARHTVLEMSYIIGQANLQGFDHIVYDTDGDGYVQDEDGYPDYGPVGADYRIGDLGDREPFYTDGIQVGALFPIWRHFTLALAAYLPSSSLMRIETQNPYVPYYVMFRNRNNRFAVSPALAFQPVHGVYFGAGAQVMTGLVAKLKLSSMVDVETFPTDDGSGGTEVNAAVQANIDEMLMSMESANSLNFGFLLDMGAFVDLDDPRYETLSRFAIGVSWRGEWFMNTNADAQISANGHITFDDEEILLSSLLEEPVVVEIRDVIGFYNPAQLAIGMRQGYGGLTLAGDLTWTDWSEFSDMVSPLMSMDIDSLAGTTVTIETGYDYGDPAFHDTWTVRVGGVYELGPWQAWDVLRDLRLHLRGGYAFVPSPVPDQTGLTNYMDSDRSVYAAGLGVEAGRVRKFSKGPVRLDIGFQYHRLAERTVVKDSSLVADQNGDRVADYPLGYPLEGSITSAGDLWVLSAGVEMKFRDPAPKPGWPKRKKKKLEGVSPDALPGSAATPPLGEAS